MLILVYFNNNCLLGRSRLVITPISTTEAGGASPPEAGGREGEQVTSHIFNSLNLQMSSRKSFSSNSTEGKRSISNP